MGLPVPATSLIDREADLAAISERLASARLLTLTGPGGVGKTRLALAAASTAGLDSAYFVDLAALGDPEHVLPTVTRTLGFAEDGGRASVAAFAESLGDRAVLLVVDNCEHLLAECAGILSALLPAAPRLRVLATSREPLGLAGETIWRVAPLPLPDTAGAASVESLARVAAIRLFVERAKAVRPDFTLTVENAPAVSAICRDLDGLPLAIELAAARVRVLTPQEIAGRLAGRFELLTNRDRTAQPRQQTLQALIDWSYDLLSPTEQRLFISLAVFAGGATLSAIEAVCAEDGQDAGKILDLVTQLVDKSLVTAEERAAGQTRLRLLETLRAYAGTKLAAADFADAVRDRHLRFFLDLVERIDIQAWSGDRSIDFTEWDVEHENFRAAFEHACRRGGNLPLRLAGALFHFWRVRGYWTEGRATLERALAVTGPAGHPGLRARALATSGSLAALQGDYAAGRPQLDEALALARELNEGRAIATYLRMLAHLELQQGNHARARALDAEAAGYLDSSDAFGQAFSYFGRGESLLSRDPAAARLLLEESLRRFRELGDGPVTALPLTTLGQVALLDGDLPLARRYIEEGLALRRASGDRGSIPSSLTKLGDVARATGDLTEAAAAYDEALELFRETANRQGIAWVQRRRGYLHLAREQWPEAATAFQESVTIAAELGAREGIALGLAGLAIVAAGTDSVRAATLLGAADHLLSLGELDPDPGDEGLLEAARALARRDLGDAAFDGHHAGGRRLPLNGALARARAVIAPARRPALLGGPAPRRDAGPLAPLSRREQEVARLIAGGLTNREIAERLVITEGTAGSHVEHILAKLGLRSRTQIAAWVLSRDTS